MIKNKKTIIIIPPKFILAKTLRVKLWMVLGLFFLVVIGFASFFVPFTNLKLNVAEQNQKKNLTEQNEALLSRIMSTLKLLNNLKDQVIHLDNKREDVLKFGVISSSTSAQAGKKINYNRIPTDELLVYVETREKNIESIYNTLKEKNNFLNDIPVIKPVYEPAVPSRVYGVSKDPFTGKEKTHFGIDFVGEIGSPVIATAGGVISRTENNPIWGKTVIIRHPDDYETVYAHLGDIKCSGGQVVKKGDIIGQIGYSGLTSGPHVHYEIKIKGTNVDPEKYFLPTELKPLLAVSTSKLIDAAN
jgi:murein DD-endopeptidase MepM/ murein hydrolase activator NlpD